MHGYKYYIIRPWPVLEQSKKSDMKDYRRVQVSLSSSRRSDCGVSETRQQTDSALSSVAAFALEELYTYAQDISIWDILRNIGFSGRMSHDLPQVAVLNSVLKQAATMARAVYYRRWRSWEEERVEWRGCRGR